MTETATHQTPRCETPPQTWTRVFPGRPDQIRHARRCLAQMLAGCPVADDAVLCLSELASNSVIHSESRKPGGTFIIHAEIRHGEYDLAADSGIGGDALTGWIAWARLDWPAPDTSLSTGAGTVAAPVQALEALAAELARRDTLTAWTSVGIREGQLVLVRGRAIVYAAGFYWWSAGRLSRGRPLYAIHAAQDPAGAARRIANLPPPG